MKKRTLYFVIGLICLSALGIIAVQLFWIRNAVRVKESQFNRSVNEALGTAVSKLETRENITYLSRNYKQDSIRILLQTFVNETLTDWQKKLQSLTHDYIPGSPPPPPPAEPARSHAARNGKTARGTQKGREQRISVYSNTNSEAQKLADDNIVNFFEDLSNPDPSRPDTIVYEIPSIYGNFEYKIIVDPNAGEGSNFFYNQQFEEQMRKMELGQEPGFFPPDPASIKDQLDKLNKKTRRIQDIIRKIAIELETQPGRTATRIDEKSLRTALKESFADRDINDPFEFAVLSPGNDSVPVPLRTKGFKNSYMETQHRVSLFPNDLFKKPDLLLVYFPDEKSHALKSLSWLMAGSSVFVLFILLTSGLSIYFMIRQKKISDIKTDFINNMTHEFKTPIATISIAADSINNPKVIHEPEAVRNYTRIIKEENSRMNARVEQVLQMALLDKRDFSLHRTSLDVHVLLEKLASGIRIQVEQKDGSLELMFHATRTTVNADESHLANVFMALFDNAIKYSRGKPEIKVETRNTDDSILIQFRDSGIGMSGETKKKVFEKFFRVTHGNIHDVKGFGLGLSYARAILLAHGGGIQIESEPGKGSTFEVTLPVA